MSTRNVSPDLDVTTPMTLSPRAAVYYNKQNWHRYTTLSVNLSQTKSLKSFTTFRKKNKLCILSAIKQDRCFILTFNFISDNYVLTVLYCNNSSYTLIQDCLSLYYQCNLVIADTIHLKIQISYSQAKVGIFPNF